MLDQPEVGQAEAKIPEIHLGLPRGLAGIQVLRPSSVVS